MPIDSESEAGAWQRELDQRPKMDVHKWAERNSELHLHILKMQEVIKQYAPGHSIIHETFKLLSDVPQGKERDEQGGVK